MTVNPQYPTPPHSGEHWRRDEEDEATWHYTHYGPGEVVEFASLDVFVPMEEIYSGIDFNESLAEE
jgi:hypothetical protein